MPDRAQLAASALGLVAVLVLAATPAVGAEDLERVGSVPIEEPFESQAPGPSVGLADDREAAGTVDVPDHVTAVEFRLTWPSEDGGCVAWVDGAVHTANEALETEYGHSRVHEVLAPQAGTS